MGCIKEADSSDYQATDAITPEEAQCNQDSNGDPVNMVTGAFTFAEHDISIPTKRLVIDLTRHYNNQLHDSDPQILVSGFGRGWSHSLSLHLEPGPGPAQISYVDDLGTRIIFTIVLNQFEVTKDKFALHRENNGFAIMRDGKLVATFDAQGNHQKVESEIDGEKDVPIESELKAGPDFFQVTYKESEKHIIIFELSHTMCSFIPPAGALALELDLNSNGGFCLRQVDGLTAGFDASGKLIQLVRPGPRSDSRIDLAYDPLDRLITASDSNGRGIKFHYQSESRLIHKVSDHAERCWVYQYNEHQELVEVCDPANRVRRYSYLEWSGTVATGKGKVASSKIRAINRIFPFTEKGEPVASQPELINQYTSDCRVARQKNILGQVTRFDYNRFTYTTYMTDPSGWTTVYAFNANGSTTKVRKPGGGTKEFIYDNRNNLLAEIDEAGNVTQYVTLKDPHRLDKEKEFGLRANGNRSAYVTLCEDEIATGYDAFGNRPLVRDALGYETRFFEYNRFGRPQRVELPDGSSVFFKFDERSGLPLRTEKTIKTDRPEALTQVQEWQYDSLGNPIRYEEFAIGPKGPIDLKRVVAIEYDVDGNHPITRREWIESKVEGETFPSEEHYSWDTLGRLISKTCLRRTGRNDDLHTFKMCFGYDSLGNEIWRINFNGTATCSLRDLQGRVIETFLVAEASPNALPNVPLENRLERKIWHYDALGQEIAFIDAVGAQTLREWDLSGHCVKVTDPTGLVTVFEYDRDGNLITKRLNTGYQIQTSYDKMGRPLIIFDSGGSYSERTYDPLGRVKEITEGRGDKAAKTQFQYDVLGYLNGVIHPNGSYERFNYNGVGRLVYHDKGTKEIPGQYVELYNYDALGRRTAIQAGSVNRMHLLFNIKYKDSQRAVQVYDSLGNCFQTFYDSVNNVIRKIDGESRAINFEHDGMNRLIRLWTDDGFVTSTYSYDTAGRLETAQEIPVRYDWQYDKAGRVLRHKQTIGKHSTMLTYEYDSAGRLITKHVDDAWWMQFDYTPSTPFISKINLPGKTAVVHRDAIGRIIEEEWNDGGIVRYQFHDDGSLIGKENYDECGQKVSYQQLERDSLGRPFIEVRCNPQQENRFQYTYDQFDQLVGIDRLDGGIAKPYLHYVFDELGNRIEEYREGGLFASYDYDSACRLIERRESAGQKTSYQYDRN